MLSCKALSTIMTTEREIVLSASLIGTPQILLIGVRDNLEALRIPVSVENPAIGKDLSNHVLIPNVFCVKDGEGLNTLFQDFTLLNTVFD